MGGPSESEFVVRNPERVRIRYIVEMSQKKPEEIKADNAEENDSE